MDIVAEAGLHDDPARLRGSVVHRLGCLSEVGKRAMTSLGSSAAMAQRVFDETRQALLEAGAARSLPQGYGQ